MPYDATNQPYVPREITPDAFAPDVKPSMPGILHDEITLGAEYTGLTDSLKTGFKSLSATTQNKLSETLPDLVDKPKFLTPDDYKKSEYYREGLSYPKGTWESIAKYDAIEHDEKQTLAENESLASQTRFAKFLEGAAVFAGNAFNPVNLGIAIGATIGATELLGAIGVTAATLSVVEGASLASKILPFVATKALFAGREFIAGDMYGQAEDAAQQHKLKQQTGQEFDWRRNFKAGGFAGGMFAAIGTVGVPLLSATARALKIPEALGKLKDVTRQVFSRENHSVNVESTAEIIGQDKVPDPSKISKQGMFNQRKVDDPENLLKVNENMDIIKDNMEKLKTEAERIQDLPKTEENANEIEKIHMDYLSLEKQLSDHENLKSILENPESPIKTEDIQNWMRKISDSDAVIGERSKTPLSEDTEVKPLGDEEDKNAFVENTKGEFAASKNEMDKSAQAHAETPAHELQDNIAAKKYHDDIENCLNRNRGKF